MFFIILLDKQVQYPSLDSVQDSLAKFRMKSIVNNDLTDIKSKLDHNDNYSSEEELNSQEIAQTSIERPVFDRSTKV